MYYIRTADRLQRTARSQEKLPGGMAHVVDVVVNDSLGIAGEFEEAVALHVVNYEDEWAATLADPERLRRFRPFVNAPEFSGPGFNAPDMGSGGPAAPVSPGPAAPVGPGPAAPGRPVLIATGIPVRPADAHADAHKN